MLEACRGGPGPISLSIERVKILIKFSHRGPGAENEYLAP